MELRSGASVKPIRKQAFAALAAVAVLTYLFWHHETPFILALLVTLSGLFVLVLWPRLAIPVVVFLLYTNLPALATDHGAPRLAASLFMLPLVVPLLHQVILRREGLRIDAALGLMLVYLAVLLASSFGAIDASITAEFIKRYVLEGVVLYWLIINVIRNHSTLKQVIWTMLFAGSLLGALTLYQEATGSFEQQFGGLAQRNYEFLALQQRAQYDPEAREAVRNFPFGSRSTRPGGPVSDPNRFAQILIVLLPLAVWTYRTARTSWSRHCAAVFGILILGGVVFSGSRGAFLTLVVLMIMASYLRWIRSSYLLMGGLVLILLIPVLAPKYVDRVTSIATVTDLGHDHSSATIDGSIRGRATEMLSALHVFLNHPVLGVGPGQFSPFYVRQYSTDPDIQFRRLSGARRAHSLYLEIAAESGAVGLAAFLGIVGLLLRNLWKARRGWQGRSREFADLATALWLSLLAYLTAATFLHLSYQWYYWFLLAVASSGLHVLRSRFATEDARSSARPDQDSFTRRAGIWSEPPRVGPGIHHQGGIRDGGQSLAVPTWHNLSE